MARSQRKQPAKAAGPSRGSKALTNARRLWPYMLMAWERWQALPPEQKERYTRQAREYAARGKEALGERRKKGKKR